MKKINNIKKSKKNICFKLCCPKSDYLVDSAVTVFSTFVDPFPPENNLPIFLNVASQIIGGGVTGEDETTSIVWLAPYNEKAMIGDGILI